MPHWLTSAESHTVVGAESAANGSPIPTRIVSNGEFTPLEQTPAQRRVELRLAALADTLARPRGLSRREFLKTASGLATAFLAMNAEHGDLFAVSRAEAADPEAAQERARTLAGQFIFDDQVHFVRDDYTNPLPFDLGRFAAKHWNPAMLESAGMELSRFKFENFLKEIYLDSDTKIALLSGAPADDPARWLLRNDDMARARTLVNDTAGSRRLLCHALFWPGTEDWLDDVDRSIETIRPEAWKGYTIGDPFSASNRPWRLDDEELVYPFYEKIRKAGIRNVCIHKGLLPKDYTRSQPELWRYATVDDVPKAARDWPDINFVIYHAALRPFLELPDAEAAGFEKTGTIQWASDLAAIPARHGVKNVFAELGTSFANSAITHPRLAAGLVATLVKGLGEDHVLWGTDSVWYGSPQWQIEALRRIEVPEDLAERHALPRLGPADGALKRAIFGLNGARLYGLDPRTVSRAVTGDTIERIKREYRETGIGRSNLAYGYIAR